MMLVSSVAKFNAENINNIAAFGMLKASEQNPCPTCKNTFIGHDFNTPLKDEKNTNINFLA